MEDVVKIEYHLSSTGEIHWKLLHLNLFQYELCRGQVSAHALQLHPAFAHETNKPCLRLRVASKDEILYEQEIPADVGCLVQGNLKAGSNKTSPPDLSLLLSTPAGQVQHLQTRR
eukprot:554889-Hanusia_phi.AAC.1